VQYELDKVLSKVVFKQYNATKNYSDMHHFKQYLWLLLILLFIVVSNRYFFTTNDAPIVYAAAGDSFSYLAISENFPSQLIHKIPFHHAQRFMIPMIIGHISHYINIPSETVALLCSIIIIALSIAASFHLFKQHGLSDKLSTVLVCVIFLNPYLARVPLAFPFMINDIAFVFGIILATLGLVSERSKPLILGCFIGIIARQTGLFLIPLIIAHLFTMRAQRHFRIAALLSIFIIIIGYLLTATIAKTMALPSQNVDHLLGLVRWLGNGFDIYILGEFLFRGLLAYSLAIGLFLGLFLKKKPRLHVKKKQVQNGIGTILLGLLIISQPVLGGPGITGWNLARLGTLGLWAIVIGVGISFETEPLTKTLSESILFPWLSRFNVALGWITLSSLHHLFSSPGHYFIGNPVFFCALQITLSLLMVATFWIPAYQPK
jgi:hypothetical protein